MRAGRVLRTAVVGVCLLAGGCTTLREVPRADLAAKPERKGVRVLTREKLLYTFDYATFDSDSLTGYRDRPDVEGTVALVSVHKIALDDVERLTTRKIDWYRTSLLGGSVVVAAIAAGLAANSPGGGTGAPDPICPRGCEGLAAGGAGR